MIQTRIITAESFIQAFADAGRGEQFSPAGLLALFAYCEGLDDDFGKPIELDVVELCCTWTEYSTIEELIAAYSREVQLLANWHFPTADAAVLAYCQAHGVVLQAEHWDFQQKKWLSYLVAQFPY